MMRLLLIVLPVAACTGAEPPPAEPSPTAATTAAVVDVAPEIPDFPGVVTSRNTRIVSADIQGRVERIHIFAGQKVRAGDPIAKLDDSDMRAEIEKAKDNEASARADAGASGANAYAANLQFKREERMGNRGYSSRAAVDNARAQRNSLGAQTAAAMHRASGIRAERMRMEALVAKSTATAPLDGIVMMIKVKEGEVAQRGAPIARVFDPKDLIMKFAVPKEHRHLVAPGKRVELRIDGVARPVWATIERIADEEPPINFAVVEADIDDSKLNPDEVRVTAQGRVRIADAGNAATGGTR